MITPRLRCFPRRARTENQRLEKLVVDAMQEFSPPAEHDKASVDLNRMVETTATVARSEWRHVGELKLSLDEDLLPVPCIADEISQVVLNMIVNAAHAIEDAQKDDPKRRGLIEISTRRDGEWAEMCISDSGSGMLPELREKIYQQFLASRNVNRGSGQGLAISRDVIVEQHQGTIECESSSTGTRFTVRLPFASAEPTSSTEAV